MLIFLFPWAHGATATATATSTCITAFQTSAFQPSAFEICIHTAHAVGRPRKRRRVKLDTGQSDRTLVEALLAAQQRAQSLQAPKSAVKRVKKLIEVADKLPKIEADIGLLNTIESAARAKNLTALIAYLNLATNQVMALKAEMDEEEMIAILLAA